MTLHVLGLVHTETTRKWSACAYTQRTMDFCSFMTDAGHRVILYAGETNEARVAEHVPIVLNIEQREWYPDLGPCTMFDDFDGRSKSWQTFNQRAAAAIRQRAEPGDIVCITQGTSHQAVTQFLSDLPLLHVETGIGYSGVFAPYRVFESAAWRHYMASRELNDNIRFFDTVIPRGYFLDDFPHGRGGTDYLFMGRLINRKGAHIAGELCKRIGARLLIAGQGVEELSDTKLVTTDGTTIECDLRYLGVLNAQERAVALGNVRAVIMPTMYLEPGGGVAIEAQLCGTPVITVPWGAMTETVIEGLTGYHCSNLAEFIEAAACVSLLDRDIIARSAARRFSAPVVAAKYGQYFKRLATLLNGGGGWYAEK